MFNTVKSVFKLYSIVSLNSDLTAWCGCARLFELSSYGSKHCFGLKNCCEHSEWLE
jgi:hypothetical protein